MPSSSPALAGAAVYFKSGSLFQCAPEKGFTCKPYAGNVKNYMNSAAIIETPAGSRQHHYLSTLVTNILAQAGKLRKLAWSDLRRQPKAPPVAYSFKYFQQVEGDVFLPAGFSPVRVEVRLQPRSGGSVSESFTWADAARDSGGATVSP